MKIDISASQAVFGLVIAVGTVLGMLVAAIRFVFTPRIVNLVKAVVAGEFEARDEEQEKQKRAEQSALSELNGRMKAMEERMAENEQASARTEEAVQRIEGETKRQTQTLQAIVDGIGDIKETLAVQREKTSRAERDIEELQRESRRRGDR